MAGQPFVEGVLMVLCVVVEERVVALNRLGIYVYAAQGGPRH